MSRLDRGALVVVVLFLVKRLAGRLGWAPTGRVASFLLGFLGFLFFLSLAYFLYRLLRWLPRRLLWSLRNRLIVAYVFIAVVPVILLLSMVGVTIYLIYIQLGAHLLQDDLRDRMSRVAATAEAGLGLVVNEADGASAVAPKAGPRSTGKQASGAKARVGRADQSTGSQGAAAASTSMQSLQEAVSQDLPGVTIRVASVNGQQPAPTVARGAHLADLVQSGDELALEYTAWGRASSAGLAAVTVHVPMTAEFLDTLAPDLGPIQLSLTKPVTTPRPRGLVIEWQGHAFAPGAVIGSRVRTLPPPKHWLDAAVTGLTTLDAYNVDLSQSRRVNTPVIASFSVRPSQLNQRLFASLGDLRDLMVIVLAIIIVLFLILEVAALITGVALTRTITHTVGDLYAATQYVAQGEFGHRIRITRRDQLGVLAESFNTMTSSISSLLEEQRQRQRLDNELAIAREVQSELFPRSRPSVPGVQLGAVCRAARVVSGDYYDFIQLGPGRFGMALADISGKGISAALLMASLQATLRSQAQLDSSGGVDTSRLMDRLNRHFLVNSSDDRYATLFYAVYDAPAGRLYYTNAGHVAPFYVLGNQVTRLEEGGTVIGLIEDAVYSQGCIQVRPGSLLVAYSDGVTEPENVYGEEFGAQRLLAEALRARGAPAQRLAERLVAAAEEWAGSPEQSDDMTVCVVRVD